MKGYESIIDCNWFPCKILRNFYHKGIWFARIIGLFHRRRLLSGSRSISYRSNMSSLFPLWSSTYHSDFLFYKIKKTLFVLALVSLQGLSFAKLPYKSLIADTWKNWELVILDFMFDRMIVCLSRRPIFIGISKSLVKMIGVNNANCFLLNSLWTNHHRLYILTRWWIWIKKNLNNTWTTESKIMGQHSHSLTSK